MDSALARQIREWRSNHAYVWDFGGWRFVDVERMERRASRRFNLFRHAVFMHAVSFEGAVFLQTANFVNAKFCSDARFSRAKFRKVAYFVFAYFVSEVSFARAEFEQRAIFEVATFDDHADFSFTRFGRNVTFASSRFAWNSLFAKAKFRSDLNLSYTSFAVLGDLSDIEVRDRVILNWPGWGRNPDTKGQDVSRGTLCIDAPVFLSLDSIEYPLLDLRSNHIQTDSRLQIYKADMRNVLLEGTDCRHIEFVQVEWHSWRRWPRWRRIFGWKRPAGWNMRGRVLIGDEYLARENPARSYQLHGGSIPWDLIAITYQQLTARFRKDLNHPLANDFEQGIFECRFMAAWQREERKHDTRDQFLLRLHQQLSKEDPEQPDVKILRQLVARIYKWRRRKRAWRSVILLWSYKFASNFGGSIWRPAWIGIMLQLISAWVYGIALCGGAFVWPWNWDLHSAWDSIVASLRVLSLDRSWFSREVDASKISSLARLGISLMALLQTALTATLVTLFIFAIRRRFKHSE
jgi:hypothetical protein